MPRQNDSLDLRLMSKVSSLYYHQEYNQQQIADRLHLSRPKVSRLLKQARKQGIVQITVASPNGNFIELETALEKKFGLSEVLIVDTELSGEQENPGILKRHLGLAAANYLHRTISEGDIIGVTWGTTLQAMVDAMQPKPVDNVHVVQTLGGVGAPEAKAHATEISRRLSKLLNSKLTLLQAPGIVGSKKAKKILLEDHQLKTSLELFPKINTVFVGIGALATNPVITEESAEVSKELYKNLVDAKAVGDIALHFFDVHGNEVQTLLKDLVIGMSLEELKNTDIVVGIAGGPEKTEAILGALNGGYIDVLITNSTTATQIVE